MQGHNVHFDVEHSQVGIAESDCDYHYLATGKKSESIDPYMSLHQIQELYSREVLIGVMYIPRFPIVFLIVAVPVIVCVYLLLGRLHRKFAFKMTRFLRLWIQKPEVVKKKRDSMDDHL